MYFGTAHQNPRILILFINLKTGAIIIQWDNGGGGGGGGGGRAGGKRAKKTGGEGGGGGGGGGESEGKGEKGGKHREVGERVTGIGSR